MPYFYYNPEEKTSCNLIERLNCGKNQTPSLWIIFHTQCIIMEKTELSILNLLNTERFMKMYFHDVLNRGIVYEWIFTKSSRRKYDRLICQNASWPRCAPFSIVKLPVAYTGRLCFVIILLLFRISWFVYPRLSHPDRCQGIRDIPDTIPARAYK